MGPFSVIYLLIDIGLALTLPFFVILLFCLLVQETKDLGVLYAGLLTNVLVCNIVVSVVDLLISEPASFGIALEFYKSNAWILGKIVYMKFVCFSVQTKIWNFLIALSRLGAILYPLKFMDNKDCQKAVRIMSTIVWMCMIALGAPVIWPLEFTYYNKGGSNNSISYGTVVVSPIHRDYAVYLPMVTFCLSVSTYITIAFILLCSPRYRKMMTSQKTAKRVTIHACLSYMPDIASITGNVWLKMPTYFPGFVEIDLDVYYLLVKLGTNAYAINTTAVLLILFPKTRRQIFKTIGAIRSNSTVIQVRRNGKSKTEDKA